MRNSKLLWQVEAGSFLWINNDDILRINKLNLESIDTCFIHINDNLVANITYDYPYLINKKTFQDKNTIINFAY